MARKVKKKQGLMKDIGRDLGARFKYKFWNAVLGSLVLILGYILFVADYPDSFRKFILILILDVLGGLIVSTTLRIKYHYFNMSFTFQFLVKRLLVATATALWIMIGMATRLFGDVSIYNVSGAEEFVLLLIKLAFWRYMLFMIIFKFIIGAVADLYADKIAFGA